VYPSPQSLLSNLIAYYPMAWDLKDTSWNGYDLTTVKGSYTWWGNYNSITTFVAQNTSLLYQTNSDVTVSIWLNNNSYAHKLVCLWSDVYSWWGMQVRKKLAYVVIKWSAYNTTALATEPTWWHMYSAVFNYTNHTIAFYLDWVLQSSVSTASWSLRWGSVAIIWASGNPWSWDWIDGYIGITFITQNAMSGTDLTKFYNATKWKYWIS